MSAREELVAAAKADLARRLGIAEEEIEVVEVRGVDWPDSSLGCRRPGMLYLQVITPGYQILLAAGGREYDYRSSMKHVSLCDR